MTDILQSFSLGYITGGCSAILFVLLVSLGFLVLIIYNSREREP